MKKILKIFICIILLLSIQFSSIASYVAYTNKDTYVYQKPSTSARKILVKKHTKVYVINSKDNFYLVYNSKKTAKGYILKKYISRNKTDDSWKSKVVKMNWFGSGQNVVKKGKYAQLYLIKTGQTIKIKRMGGTNHADIEPATKQDTEKLYKMTNYCWSWKTYPVILISDGKYVAASINAMPHGEQTILNNNFAGEICLHLTGSKTHETNQINVEHQKSINEAYKWAH